MKTIQIENESYIITLNVDVVNVTLKTKGLFSKIKDIFKKKEVLDTTESVVVKPIKVKKIKKEKPKSNSKSRKKSLKFICEKTGKIFYGWEELAAENNMRFSLFMYRIKKANRNIEGEFNYNAKGMRTWYFGDNQYTELKK
jgi:hypothetical protein